MDSNFSSSDGVVTVYDILWQDVPNANEDEHKSYEGDFIKFKRLASPPSPLLNEKGKPWMRKNGSDDEEDETSKNENSKNEDSKEGQTDDDNDEEEEDDDEREYEYGDPEEGTHRAYLNWNGCRAKFSCDISEDGKTFDNFIPIWFNGETKECTTGDIEIWFVDTLDDYYHPFLKLVIDHGYSGCSQEITDCWARKRQVVDQRPLWWEKLSDAELARLEVRDDHLTNAHDGFGGCC